VIVYFTIAIPFAAGFAWGGRSTPASRLRSGPGFVRIFLVHHVTWSINSVCHFFGQQRFATGDQSRNVFWLSLPSLGESWHHNHHAFPRSAFHGLRWYELDPSGWVILGAAEARPRLERRVGRSASTSKPSSPRARSQLSAPLVVWPVPRRLFPTLRSAETAPPRRPAPVGLLRLARSPASRSSGAPARAARVLERPDLRVAVSALLGCSALYHRVEWQPAARRGCAASTTR
jgi:hypothetical protein